VPPSAPTERGSIHKGQRGISVLLSLPQPLLALYQLWEMVRHVELATAARRCQKPLGYGTAESPRSRQLRQH